MIKSFLGLPLSQVNQIASLQAAVQQRALYGNGTSHHTTPPYNTPPGVMLAASNKSRETQYRPPSKNGKKTV